MSPRWILLLLCLFAAPLNAAERLNIISIVTDDQARWGLGCYGNAEVRTPNLDRLAKDGAKFLNAFTATPVCSPSRATFLTGRWGTELTITDWIDPGEASAGVGLRREFITWPEVLQKHGYATALIGKWHLGTRAEYHPNRRGFDRFVGFLGGGNTPINPTLEIDAKTQKLEGSLPDILTDHAIRFVEEQRAKPFALLLHFREPHAPYAPVPPEDSAPFKDLDPTVPKFPGLDILQVKQLTREYYGSIHSVDRNLGRLFRRLEELKLAGKTIVLFTSDHGYMIGQHGLLHKGNGHWIAGGQRGPKRPNMFEESIRVPLLVRWPGVMKPGTEVAELVSNLDTFASVLGMLDVPLPKGVKQHGLDFAPLLKGQKPAWRDAIFSQYDLHNGGLAYLRMVRTADWKLVRHYKANQLDELYHLDQDPGEATNLVNRLAANVNAKARARLQERLDEWMASIDDPLLK